MLYDRIDYIHEQMVAFEAFRLRAFRSPGWKRKYYALATDAQDSLVNWVSRESILSTDWHTKLSAPGETRVRRGKNGASSVSDNRPSPWLKQTSPRTIRRLPRAAE